MLGMVIQVATGEATRGVLMSITGSVAHFTAVFDAVFKGEDAEQTACRLLVLITVHNSFHFDIIIAYLDTLCQRIFPAWAGD